MRHITNSLRQLEKMTELNETPETLANKLHPLRRPLIQPATLTASQYAATWSSQKYKGKTFQPDAKGLYTSSGKRVRSKSEVIIAETLARLEVPYNYEYPNVLTSGDGRHGKITIYADNGIIAGHNLIITTKLLISLYLRSKLQFYRSL